MILLVFTIFGLVVFVGTGSLSHFLGGESAQLPQGETDRRPTSRRRGEEVVACRLHRRVSWHRPLLYDLRELSRRRLPEGARPRGVGRNHLLRLCLPSVAAPLPSDRRFIFIQGISLRLSIDSSFRKNLEAGNSPFKATLKCTLKVAFGFSSHSVSEAGDRPLHPHVARQLLQELRHAAYPRSARLLLRFGPREQSRSPLHSRLPLQAGLPLALERPRQLQERSARPRSVGCWMRLLSRFDPILPFLCAFMLC